MSEVRQPQEDRTVTVPPGTTVKVEAQQVIKKASRDLSLDFFPQEL
jgi:hypothetical protein